MKSRARGNNKYVLGIIAAVLIFAAIGLISFKIMDEDIKAGKENVRSYEIINAINNIQNRLKDLGLMRRGLLLTGDHSMLEQYSVATTEINIDLQKLDELTSYDGFLRQQVHTASIMTLQRLTNLKNSIKLYEVNRSYDRIQYSYTTISKPIVKINTAIYDDIKGRELENAKKSAEVEIRSMFLIKLLLISGSIAALLLFVYSIVKLRIYNRVILEEIELRMRKESELIEKQIEIEKLSNLSPVGIIHLDADLSIDYANGTLILMSGFRMEELMSLKFTSLIHEEDKQRFFAECNPSKNKYKNTSGEFRIVLKSGNALHVICEFAPRLNSSGNIKGYICSLTDITKLHEYQEELVKYNSLFEGITEGIPDPIAVKDANGAYEYVNTAAADFMGMEREEIIGKKDSDLLAPEIAEEISAKERSILNSGKNMNYELCAVHPDGTLKTFLSTKGVLRNSKNKIIGLFGIARDITLLKKKEEEISRSLKEKETLLKEIHHRVKNNLQIVASLLRLQSGYVKDLESKKYFMDSQNRIRSMAIIHEKLYRSSSLADINLKLYLEQLVDNLVYSLDIDISKIKIITDIAPLRIDLDHAIPVGLIINEILTNSLKYAFPGGKSGEIQIKAHEEDGDIVFSLCDNGIGLPAGKNIGDYDSLGLQLVQTLTESQLSGRLTLQSNENGVHFKISFPYTVQNVKA